MGILIICWEGGGLKRLFSSFISLIEVGLLGYSHMVDTEGREAGSVLKGGGKSSDIFLYFQRLGSS